MKCPYCGAEFQPEEEVICTVKINGELIDDTELFGNLATVEIVTEVTLDTKCQACEGKGFIEYEAGLVQVQCENCDGTGEIENVLPRFPGMSASGGIPDDMVILEEITEADTEVYTEVFNVEISKGTGQPDKPAGSPDTSKPKRTRKPKAKKKSRKGTS